MNKKIYFDHLATTSLHPEVKQAMLPYLEERFGNPSSLHYFGLEARKAIEEARQKVAAMLEVLPEEIIFTSSGAESNNLAIKGVALAYQKKGKHIIASQIEHFSILHPLKTLEKWGFRVTRLPVNKYGLIDPQELVKAITEDTILVSIMIANGEIGTIEPIMEMSRITRERGVYFHTDAVAAVGRIPVNISQLGVDLLSLSAHQFYGPKGVGALVVRKGIRLIPLIEGGIQEEGRRAGTENVPAIVGMGKAAQIIQQELPSLMEKLKSLGDCLVENITSRIPEVYLNGHPTLRLPGYANFSFKYVEGESILLLLNQQGIAAASGSACTSRALKASHVLTAMGIDPALAQGSILFTLGRGNTPEDIDRLLEVLPSIVDRLRKMSPLYEDERKSTHSPL